VGRLPVAANLIEEKGRRPSEHDGDAVRAAVGAELDEVRLFRDDHAAAVGSRGARVPGAVGPASAPAPRDAKTVRLKIVVGETDHAVGLANGERADPGGALPRVVSTAGRAWYLSKYLHQPQVGEPNSRNAARPCSARHQPCRIAPPCRNSAKPCSFVRSI